LVLWGGDVVVRRVILGAAIREIMVDASEGWRESGGEGLRGVDFGIWDVEAKDLELSTEYARSAIGLERKRLGGLAGRR
jgi:hypothetical protein